MPAGVSRAHSRRYTKRGLTPPPPPPPPPPPAPPILSIGPESVTHNEGGVGTTTAYVFTVSRFGNANAAASVAWAVTGSGANPTNSTDFTGATSGTVTLAEGVLSATITVTVSGDITDEQSEMFQVTLSNPVGCTIGTSGAYGIVTNDDAAAPPPPPPPPAPGSVPAWVTDVSRFDDYVLRLEWDATPANGYKVAAPQGGETQCPGFATGALVKNIAGFTNTIQSIPQRICGIIHLNVPWPKGVTVYLPAGTFYLGKTTFRSIGVRVNIRFVGAATAKTWMTAGTTDGTHFDFSDATRGFYVNLEGVIRFDNITWRHAIGGGVSRHVMETSSIFNGCFQYVGCEFRWAADAFKMHEADTNDKENYAQSGGYGGGNPPRWTADGVKKDTGTAIWMHDCVVRECGGYEDGLKHGLIYALNGNALRCSQVAVIDTTRGYLGAKAGVNVVYMENCLLANRWNTDSYGKRLFHLFPNNNAARYWGDTLLEPQPGASEVVVKDTQFFARAEQSYDGISFSANPANGSTLTINGFTVTFVTGTPAANQVLIGASSVATTVNLAAALAVNPDPVAQSFTYEAISNTPTMVISGKTLPKAAPTVVGSTSPASHVTFGVGGDWMGGVQTFIYDHLRGKMPFAGGGKTPDYFVREGLAGLDDWRGIWWNNGVPATSDDATAKAGYGQAFNLGDITPTTVVGYGSCSFTGSSGSWPRLTLDTYSSYSWYFVENTGVLAGNRGRFATLGAYGRVYGADKISTAITAAVDLAAIPNTDAGHGILCKMTVGRSLWMPATAYGEGNLVEVNGLIYKRHYMNGAPAASGNTAPTGTGTLISDGAYLWDYVGPVMWYGLTYHRTSGTLKLVKRVGTTDTVLAQAVVGSVSSARIRLREHDGALMGKLWPIGTNEPATWQITATSAPSIVDGYVGLAGTNSASEYIEFANLTIDSPFVGATLRCGGGGSGMAFYFPWFDEKPYGGKMPAPYNATNYWRASVTIEDANGVQTAHTSLATGDGTGRLMMATPVPAGYVIPANTRVYLALAARNYHDVRHLTSAYHNPADPDYYWSKLYRVDGTVKQPGDAGFNDVFHVRYVDNCSFTYVGPAQSGGQVAPIMKHNTSAFCAYLGAKDDEGYYVMPPQWHAQCGWSKPTGAGTWTDVADTGNRFFGGSAPTGFRGHQGSDFTDPSTWMFTNCSHYCLPSEFRGNVGLPRTTFKLFDDPSGPPANGQVAPRPRVFALNAQTGALDDTGNFAPTVLTTLTQGAAKGAATVHVASATGFAVGHKIEIPLANDPWGLTQSDDPVTGRIKPYADTHVWRHVTRIAGLAGTTVTLADPLPDPFPGDGLTQIAVSGATVAITPAATRPAHVITRFEDCPTARQTWPS